MGRMGLRCTAMAVLAVIGGGLDPGSPAFAAAGLTEQVGFRASVGTGGSPLNVRSGPATTFSQLRQVGNGSPLGVSCQVLGERVVGSVRTSDLWNRLSAGGYVSDAYVVWRSSRPRRCVRAAIDTNGGPLNLRNNTSRLNARVGQLRGGAPVTVVCQLAGETITGTQRRTAIWDRLSTGHYVSDGYVAWSPARPPMAWCTLPGARSPADHAAFISWTARYAGKAMARYRVPASVSIAQAILESGWGGSGLTRAGNAYFGMKCFDTPGVLAAGCRPFATHECAGTRCFPTTAMFRMYANAYMSFMDHGRQLATLERYRPAFAYVHDANRFAVEVHRAGYATSPTYAANLIDIMRRYNLYRFDGAHSSR